jgi:hypothetical protein
VTGRLLALLTGFVALITACGSGSTVAPAAAPSGAGSSSAGAHVPMPAQLQSTAKTLDGRQFSGESLLGKPAVLWFWRRGVRSANVTPRWSAGLPRRTQP